MFRPVVDEIKDGWKTREWKHVSYSSLSEEDGVSAIGFEIKGDKGKHHDSWDVEYHRISPDMSNKEVCKAERINDVESGAFISRMMNIFNDKEQSEERRMEVAVTMGTVLVCMADRLEKERDIWYDKNRNEEG